jgi:DNA-3-methyladenine glycosylase I
VSDETITAISTITAADGKARCAWVGSDAEYERYHDEEWGVPLHGDQRLFEKLTLEGFQAGLSWITILRKRDAFRQVFHRFNIDRVASLADSEIELLMLNAGIVRNRAKIVAARGNAAITRELIRDSPGAFDTLLWSFQPATTNPRRGTLNEVPTQTVESAAMSLRLKALGYRFVGPTSMYALMQSTGMVNDHVDACWLSHTVERASLSEHRQGH